MEREEEAHESKERGREGRGREGRGSEGRGSEGRGSEGRGSEGRGSEGRGSELLRCGAKRPMTAFAGKAETFGLRPLFVRAGGH